MAIPDKGIIVNNRACGNIEEGDGSLHVTLEFPWCDQSIGFARLASSE